MIAQGADRGHGFARRSFERAARDLIMRLQREYARITVLRQRAQLPGVVYYPRPHLRPVALVVHILEVHVGHAAPDVGVAAREGL